MEQQWRFKFPRYIHFFETFIYIEKKTPVKFCPSFGQYWALFTLGAMEEYTTQKIWSM